MSLTDMNAQKSKNLRIMQLSAVGILLNVLPSLLVSKLGLPLYLDSIGTILSAAAGGIVPGTIAAFLTNLIKGFWDLSSVYYIPINILLALLTAFLAPRKMLTRFPGMLLAVICFALAGGVIGGVLTWYLNGSVFGGSVLSSRLLESGFSPFLAQIGGDFLYDLADKAISLAAVILLLRMLPQHFVDSFSSDSLSLILGQVKVRKLSLHTKVMLLIAGLMLFVGIAVTGITLSLFHNSILDENADFAYSAARLAADAFDADRVSEYLEKGEAAEGYLESEAALARIVESADNIDYVYVYQIREDGCHVVLDPDTAAGPGDDPGDVVAFDEAFLGVLDTLLKGGEIDPIISNEKYGWLLSVYLPVTDSRGVCQCYVGVDVSMPRLHATERVFQTEMISLFLGFSMLITVLAIWLADNSVIRPINDMAAATTAFASRSVGIQEDDLAVINALDIRTGDEIENLYRAIASTTAEVVQNVVDIQHKNDQITRLQSGLIMVLADMVESRDKCTGNHVRNTASYVNLILQRMREKGEHPALLTDEYIHDVVSSAPLHDVGKITVPDALLNKPGKLTEEEFAIMKQHTVAGGEIIDNAIDLVADANSQYLNEAKKLTLYHHERWDGKGYPYGIRGEDIPLSARVMAVADVFDALVSRRSYKEGFPPDKAFSIIQEESGTHFDPDVVQAFLDCRPQATAIANAATVKNTKEY